MLQVHALKSAAMSYLLGSASGVGVTGTEPEKKPGGPGDHHHLRHGMAGIHQRIIPPIAQTHEGHLQGSAEGLFGVLLLSVPEDSANYGNKYLGSI